MKPIELRACKKCGLRKTVREFYKVGSGKPRWCKECLQDPPSLEYKTRNPNRGYEARLRQRRIEANRERVRRWRKSNRKLWKKQQEQAERKEKERGYPDTMKRRALAHDAFVEVVDKKTLYMLHEGLCGLCGEPLEYSEVTIDHIIPLSRGGKHQYENCQLAHGLCNRRKGDRLPDELEEAA